jgi:hypothetical protein
MVTLTSEDVSLIGFSLQQTLSRPLTRQEGRLLAQLLREGVHHVIDTAVKNGVAPLEFNTARYLSELGRIVGVLVPEVEPKSVRKLEKALVD